MNTNKEGEEGRVLPSFTLPTHFLREKAPIRAKKLPICKLIFKYLKIIFVY
jgi:hypothetical protein